MCPSPYSDMAHRRRPVACGYGKDSALLAFHLGRLGLVPAHEQAVEDLEAHRNACAPGGAA